MNEITVKCEEKERTIRAQGACVTPLEGLPPRRVVR